MWCAACGELVDVAIARSVGLPAAPLVSLAATVPRLLGKRLGRGGSLLQVALGMGVGYLAQRYLVPKVQAYVCKQCGVDVSLATAA